MKTYHFNNIFRDKDAEILVKHCVSTLLNDLIDCENSPSKPSQQLTTAKRCAVVLASVRRLAVDTGVPMSSLYQRCRTKIVALGYMWLKDTDSQGLLINNLSDF